MAEGGVFMTPVKQEPDGDPGDPNNTSVDMKEALVQTDIKFEEMLQEGFHGIKKENPDIFVAPCSPATPSPATPLASFPLNLPHPTCYTTSTKATCFQSSQTDLPSTNISQKRERLTPHEGTVTFEAGSGGMMTRSKLRSSEKMTLFVLGSSEMTTPAKRFSDMTTPAHLGSSGIKSSGTKKFKKRRMLAKNGSSEKGSNGMVTPTMKGFITRATPTKEKSSVMTPTKDMGLCGLTSPVVEESRRMSAQAKQRSNQYSASLRKRSSERMAADEMGFTETRIPGQGKSSCINIAGEEGSCGIRPQAKKRSTERTASAKKRLRMWTPPSEENDSTDPTTSSDKVSVGLRTPSHGPTTSATEDSSDLTTPGSNGFNRWHSATDEDEQPPALPFCPKRTPGVQLDSCWTYSPSELFQLYFSRHVIQTLCDNTNTNAKRKLSQGKSTTSWSNVHPEDMLKFLSIIIYFSLVKTSSIRDLWRKDHLQSFCFPSCIMQRKRFEDIKAHLRMSDPGEDAVNDELKGHPGYDHLFSLKPLMDQIHTACRSFFHPYENLSMDELMVVTKAQTDLKQYLKDKWGYKLFTLADCKTGYVCDFSISECKAWKPSKNGLSFNVVTGLLNVSLLGTGYNVYIDDIHSSPALFTHLHQLNYRVCGTMQETSSRIPSTLVNAMPKKAQQGEMRWIRDGPLLFIKWKGTREVTMCSSIHKAYNGKTAERRIREPNGTWSVRRVPVPEPVPDYNKHMGQAELSDALKYYSHTLKFSRWFFKMFLNFIEIAVLNSYILHKELALEKQGKPLTQKHFREVLCQELAALCSKDSKDATFKTPKSNLPPLSQLHEDRRPQGCFPVCMYSDPLKMKSQGKKTCTHCHSGKTVFKCRSCDVPLCITMDRMCFTNWHDSKRN